MCHRRLLRFLLVGVVIFGALIACEFPSMVETIAPEEESILPTGPALATMLPAPSAPHCTDPQPPFVTGLEVYQTPKMDEPQARLPFRDPVFGTCIVRVTDRHADLSPDDTSAGLKNEYSRVQSFNADGSLILVRGIEATWYVYSAGSLQPLGQLPIDIDPRWSATDPNII